jgi:hypothetical protein
LEEFPDKLGKKCNRNSTNLKRLSTHSKLAENLGKKVQKKEGKISDRTKLDIYVFINSIFNNI